MESYEAYTNVNGVIEMVENMCSTVFDDLELSTDISFDEKNADFSFPWAKASMFTLVSEEVGINCLLYTSPSPRDRTRSRMPSSA